MNKELLTKIAIVIILVALLTVGIVICGGVQKEFSPEENRVLTKVPKFSFGDFMTGEYQSTLNKALTDQFPGRNDIIAFGTELKLLSGRKDIGGVYIGEDHYYMEKVTDSDISFGNYRKNLEILNRFSKSFPKVSFTAMLVPSSGIVLEDRLPANAMMYDDEKLYNTEVEIIGKRWRTIDMRESLSMLGEDAFFKTDHHWTLKGAYKAYEEFLNYTGKFPKGYWKKASEDFLGSLYSKTLGRKAISDKIYIPKGLSDYAVTVDGKESHMLQMDKLNEKDQYGVFFGGNFGRIDIKGRGKGRLMVIKDSFANSMVPFLVDDYEEIIMIDLRYYPASVTNLIKEQHISEVLLLYEADKFANDSNIVKLLLN